MTRALRTRARRRRAFATVRASIALSVALVASSSIASVAPLARAQQPPALGVASVSLGYDRPFGVRPRAAMNDHAFVDIRLAGAYGRTIAYAAAFEVATGGAIDGGYVTRSELLPLGVALRFGKTGYLSLLGGIGVDAATAIGAAFRLPTELRFEVDLGAPVRLLMAARVAWLFGHDVLDAGAPDLEGVDEVEAMLGWRIGSRGPNGSSGYYVALTGAERQGARLLGVLVGVAVSTGGR